MKMGMDLWVEDTKKVDQCIEKDKIIESTSLNNNLVVNNKIQEEKNIEDVLPSKNSIVEKTPAVKDVKKKSGNGEDSSPVPLRSQENDQVDFHEAKNQEFGDSQRDFEMTIHVHISSDVHQQISAVQKDNCVLQQLWDEENDKGTEEASKKDGETGVTKHLSKPHKKTNKRKIQQGARISNGY